MSLLGTLKAMKKQQLFWTMFCVLSLLENKISGERHQNISTTKSSSEMNASSVTSAMTTLSPTMEHTYTSVTLSGKPHTDGIKITEGSSLVTSPGPTQTHTDMPDQSVSMNTSLHSEQTTPQATYSGTTQATTSEMVSTATTVVPEQTSHSATTGHPVKPFPFTCPNINHVEKTKVICLLLSESDTCDNFVKTKGANLRTVICDTAPCYNHSSLPQCNIELATSKVNPYCMLLIQACGKDADIIEALLQRRESDLNKLGVKSHTLMNIKHHQYVSRKTLIALVTSGLLLAVLGLAGYFLMKRRSWSPMGERLGEDPYYTENDSQGNTVITVASQEQLETQEKPNLNGGAQKNGTGQTSSKNGHSARQHVVADTEL
ncbi:hematopoietic progenitor cell antigen CD34 isoform X2 [Emydura macquarii macquarii]|uniref:hematopoietic progenitor cell antigen CD34 isoform X2 n=1 Tax=Emydura macquarii macquarii TaxID=1129001 RepID=UPI00352B7EC1